MSKVTLTEADFCRALGISRTTVWNLRKKNRISYIKVGRKILYTQQHLEQFLAEHQRPLESPKQGRKKD